MFVTTNINNKLNSISIKFKSSIYEPQRHDNLQIIKCKQTSTVHNLFSQCL